MIRETARTRRLAPLALAVMAASSATGAPPPISPSSLLTPLEAGIADRGPSSISLRRLNLEFRQDSAFEHVYAVPGRPDLFMRRRGAITAVFPESRYLGSAGGDVAVIPPGAVFHIGLPTHAELPLPVYSPLPQSSLADLAQPPVLSRPLSAPIDARVARPVAQPTIAPRPKPEALAPSDFQSADLSNAFVRARRLRLIAAQSSNPTTTPTITPTITPPPPAGNLRP